MQENRKCILRTENLRYTYANGQPALKMISLCIYEGERIAVIGPNGSGKTTFFLNLNGVYLPTGGNVVFKDAVMTKQTLNTLRQNVGIVFQEADNQIIASTVRQEVGFGPMNLRLPREEVIRRVNEALSCMQITTLADRPPHYLSGGEKKRVGIADILAMQPEIFLFDEPTASLDPDNADMLEDILLKLGEKGKTILISTHDVELAYRWADRILVFCEHSIIADAPPLTVFRDIPLLQRASLRQPLMLQIYELLVANGIVPPEQSYPRRIVELDGILQDRP